MGGGGQGLDWGAQERGGGGALVVNAVMNLQVP